MNKKEYEGYQNYLDLKSLKKIKTLVYGT